MTLAIEVPATTGAQLEVLLWMEGGYILVRDPFERYRLCAPPTIPGRKVPLMVYPDTMKALKRKGLIQPDMKWDGDTVGEALLRFETKWTEVEAATIQIFRLTTTGRAAAHIGRNWPKEKR